MAEWSKLLYLIVTDEAGEDAAAGVQDTNSGTIQGRNFPASRYTRSVLQSTLQLMGCKPRHALKISDRVFDVFRGGNAVARAASSADGPRHQSPKGKEEEASGHVYGPVAKKEQNEHKCGTKNQTDGRETLPGSGNPKASKKRSTVTVNRDKFLDVVCDALGDYQYVGPNQRADLVLACRVREKKTSVTVFLCGTSGCGKSTLSSLLASRLGITTVVSTDSVRHMMRSFVSETENSLLWASTYHAGECLDPVAIAESKIKSKAAKMPTISIRNAPLTEGRVVGPPGLDGSPGLKTNLQEGKDRSSPVVEAIAGNGDGRDEGKTGLLNEVAANVFLEGIINDVADTTVGTKTIVVQGFKAQSEMVMDSLDRLITTWEQKNESVVVEGVHLSLNFVMGLMKKHRSIVPFMVYISNEDKHLERFAVRAKYMTLDPAKNKYVKYIRNIRTIQEYLCKRADKHLVPKVNNTNVDKSIAIIHATVFSCLRRRMGGEPLCDPVTNTVKVVDQEYRSQYTASSLGSKGMFQLIQRRGSSRHLMALMNIDGSVAKAWPIEADSSGKPVAGSSNGSESGVGTPVYGPLAIGKAEPVNVRFGNFGLSAWPTDTGAPSNPVSISSGGDGQTSRGECELSSSCPGSSCSSSPKHLEGGEKELTEEVVVLGSDEEADEEEPRAVDSNGESSDSGQEHIEEDEGGSVDDQSERSDDDAEEFEAMHPVEDGFWSEDTLIRSWQLSKSSPRHNSS